MAAERQNSASPANVSLAGELTKIHVDVDPLCIAIKTPEGVDIERDYAKEMRDEITQLVAGSTVEIRGRAAYDPTGKVAKIEDLQEIRMIRIEPLRLTRIDWRNRAYRFRTAVDFSVEYVDGLRVYENERIGVRGYAEGREDAIRELYEHFDYVWREIVMEDDNGNLTWDGAKGYKSDGFNRLREVSDGGGTIVTFVYDAQNRLARKDRPGTTNDIDYGYTGWQVVEQYESGDDDPKRQFIYGNYIDEVLVMDTNEDDDDSCTYEYNSRTLLGDISGGGIYHPDGTPFILKGREYTPSGQAQTAVYGNGLVTYYAYDSCSRLSSLATARPNEPEHPPSFVSLQFRRRVKRYANRRSASWR